MRESSPPPSPSVDARKFFDRVRCVRVVVCMCVVLTSSSSFMKGALGKIEISIVVRGSEWKIQKRKLVPILDGFEIHEVIWKRKEKKKVNSLSLVPLIFPMPKLFPGKNERR